MDLPPDGHGSQWRRSLTRKPVPSTGLCSKCSPYFGAGGAIQEVGMSVSHSVEEVRANKHCACCRMLNSVLSNATSRAKIKTIRIDQSEIAIYDQDLTHLLGSITSGQSQRARQQFNRRSQTDYRLVNVDPVSGTLDYRKLRMHLQRCKSQQCMDVETERERYRTSIGVTLVDVENMCLVRASTRLPYVALSYVWGGVTGNLATSANREQLEEPGSLTSIASSIPSTIKDAMTLVNNLGERWLWCDQLCIEQDNAAQKHSSIRNMDIIYRQSLLTIVAFGTSKSSDELPGIRRDSMQRPKHLELIDGCQCEARATSHLTDQISHSVYESRAWTFAERMLSPRCLYMTLEFILYHCKNGHSDDAWKDLRRHADRSHGEIVKAFAQDLNAATQSSWHENRALYKDLVAVYTKRQLGFASDRLNAFSAVLSMLNSGDWSGTLCGLPEGHLDEMLLWQPPDDSVSPALLRNPLFPSWSWAGWSGSVIYDSKLTSLQTALAGVQHSHQTRRRTVRRDWTLPRQASVQIAETPGIDVLFFQTEWMSANEQLLEYTSNVSATDVNLGSFSRAQAIYQRTRARNGVYIRHNNQQVGALHSSWEEFTLASRELLGVEFLGGMEGLTFIKLSTATCDDEAFPDARERVLIMLVGYASNGLAERLAIGYFIRSFWESKPRLTKEFALG